MAKTYLETYMYVLKDKTSKIVTLQKLLSCSKHSKIQHYNYLYKYKLTILYRIQELAYIHTYDTLKIQYIDVYKTKSFPCFA